MKKLIIALLCLTQLPLFAGQPAAGTNNSRAGIYVGAAAMGAGIAWYTAYNMYRARKDFREKAGATPEETKAYKTKQAKFVVSGLLTAATTAGICFGLNQIDGRSGRNGHDAKLHARNGNIAIAGLGLTGLVSGLSSYKMARAGVKRTSSKKDVEWMLGALLFFSLK